MSELSRHVSTENGVRGGRLPSETLRENYCDLHPPLTPGQAAIEASRCYYCFDAPCIRACPTGIDIPSFIRKISTGNLKGSARDILEANPLGGSCARVCPTETLCEEACVRNHQEEKPVTIGLLQRHSTDWLFEKGIQLFKKGESNGKRVAVVGAGPAGLACAHGLARAGTEVVLFDAKARTGGLNEYGIAAYKMTDQFAQKEVNYLLEIGGIRVELGKALGRDFTLESLRKDFDAVFLGLGLGATHSLGVEGENLEGIEDAVDYIEKIRECREDASKLSELPVGRRVVVIGGGNTAIDIAVQIKKLGAEFVTLVYRRGEAQMNATGEEQVTAQKAGVLLKTWLQPKRFLAAAEDQTRARVSSVEFEYTEVEGGQLRSQGTVLAIEADQVFKAIGQRLNTKALGDEIAQLETVRGKICVGKNHETSLRGVYAGGDCTPGNDLTVRAVQDGKEAAMAILRSFDLPGGGSRG